MDTNTSNESLGCYHMTAEELRTSKAVGVGANSFTGLACAIAIFLIIFLRAYKSFLVRLVLYLNLTILCLVIAKITKFLPVKSVNGTLVIHNRDFCTATAFTDGIFFTLASLTCCSLALYLICLTTSKNIENLHSRAREICGVITAVTIAIVMATIPLIPFDGDTAYGLDGFNCGVGLNDEFCELSTVALTEYILLFFIPWTAAVVFIVIALVFAVRALCKKPKKHPKHKYMQEAQILVVYMTILTIVYLTTVAVSMVYVFSPERDSDLNLKLAVYVIWRLVGTSIPAAFIFHPTTLKKLRCSEVKQEFNKWRGIHDDEVYTSYHVPPEPEFSEYSDLVITGTHRDRRNSGYRTMLEQPIAEA